MDYCGLLAKFLKYLVIYFLYVLMVHQSKNAILKVSWISSKNYHVFLGCGTK
jgi:hypothetical protein